MTSGELIRSARLRASLPQADLAKRLGMPRSQIGRWEADDVDPGFTTVRRVLRACGFDLSMGLVPYAPDVDHEARLAELQRLTRPKSASTPPWRAVAWSRPAIPLTRTRSSPPSRGTGSTTS